MPDYKELYQKMVIASEAAINILIAAQRECEEIYINSPEPTITALPRVEKSDCLKETAENK